jgi:arsenate reductase-like glutaredoxin family protein
MDKKVQIYITPTCHCCAQAKRYFKEKGTEVEVVFLTLWRENCLICHEHLQSI